MSVGRVLAVANQKGGAGKSTTAVNMAVGLARAGRGVLLWDLDPQCCATRALGREPADRHPLLATEGDRRPELVPTAIERLDLMPGCRSFQDIYRLANGDTDSTSAVQRRVSELGREYDFLLLDCPPSLGTLTQTALASASEVLMPIPCEYFAMEGLTDLIHMIRDVMRQPGRQLEFGGIVLTRYDCHMELTEEVATEVRDFFGDIVFDTVIPQDAAIAEASRLGRSVLEHAPRSRGARAYIELCMEVLDRD